MEADLPNVVRVPALLSRERTMWLSVVVALIGVGVVLASVFATQPDNRPFVVVAAVLGVAGVLAVLGRRTVLDLHSGELVRVTFFVRRSVVAWAEAEQVRFTNNRGGQLLLEVRGRRRRTATYLPLVAVDLGGDRSQEPSFLRLLADQIETWSPRWRVVVDGLRAEAGHLESGGSVRESPLARRYLARTWTRAE